MPTELNLRSGTTEDEHIIFNLLMEMYQEARMGSLNPQKVKDTVRTTIENGVILLVEQNGQPCAVMGLKMGGFWWCDDNALMDAFTFVSKKARKTRAFFMLINQAKRIAQDCHVPLVLANFGPVDEERKSKLFKRIGQSLGTTVITGDTSQFLWK